jgi:type IV secretion system protein VirB1
MAAIVKQESGGRPWVINNNTTKKSSFFDSMAEAVAAARAAIDNGESIDMGLAQINSKNLKNLGIAVDQIFDPCTNISAGAKILEYGFKETGSLPAALSMYNTGKADSKIGSAYAKKVFSQAGVTVPAIPNGQLTSLPNLNSQSYKKQLPPVVLKVTPSPYFAGLGLQSGNDSLSPSWK